MKNQFIYKVKIFEYAGFKRYLSMSGHVYNHNRKYVGTIEGRHVVYDVIKNMTELNKPLIRPSQEEIIIINDVWDGFTYQKEIEKMKLRKLLNEVNNAEITKINNNNNNNLNMYDYGRLVKSMLMQDNEYGKSNMSVATEGRIKNIIQVNDNQGIICEPCKSGRLKDKQYYGLRLLNKDGKFYTAMRHTDIKKLQYIKDAIDAGKLNGNEINMIKVECNNYKIAENTFQYLKGKLE